MTRTQPVWRRALLAICLTAAIAGCSDSNSDVENTNSPQDETYRLQLLHFADMDGSTAALDYVSNFSRLVNAFSSDEALA